MTRTGYALSRSGALLWLSLLAGAVFAADAPPPPAAPVATPVAVAAPAPRGLLLDKVVAIVDEGVVTSSELDDQTVLITDRLRQQEVQLPPDDVLRKQVLDRLVLQEIQSQRAARVGIKISDEQLNAALQDVAKRNNMTLSQLPEALASQGVDYATYRENMRKEIQMASLRQRDVLARINVTPRELEQFMEKQKKQPSELEEYNVSHILLAVPQNATSQQMEELAKRAQDLHDRATKGEDFGQLALQYSNSQTALERGALGWRKGPELPTFLADVVVKLKAGETSEPLRTPTGFHLVKLNETRSADGAKVVSQTHARHILIKPNALQDDATVRQKLIGLRERVLKGEDFAVFATSMSEDSGSAVNGGDLGWSNPGTFVPEFTTALDQLKDNEISEPIRSEFGWHLIQLLGRRQFDTTDEVLRQRAFAQLRESKADEETELWLRRLRDEAFVEYRL
ncbi:MAG: peptidylprolyl isomerase [Steroidobacteraceae bacterium]